jgi:hypothetical protein
VLKGGYHELQRGRRKRPHVAELQRGRRKRPHPALHHARPYAMGTLLPLFLALLFRDLLA